VALAHDLVSGLEGISEVAGGKAALKDEKRSRVTLKPFTSAWRTLCFVLAGRLHFPRQRVGETILLDGQAFRIFRHVIVDGRPPQPIRPEAVFIPRFPVAGMSAAANQRFSWLPIPFYVGLPGFRSKLRLVDDATGEFAGIYEWDTPADAENYGRSFAATFMTARRGRLGNISHLQTG